MDGLKLLTAGLVAAAMMACGDDGDRGAACKEEKELTEKILAKAAETDQISPQGLCALTQAQVAQRVKASQVWASAPDEAIDDRAQQYVSNCGKLAKAKADCGD